MPILFVFALSLLTAFQAHAGPLTGTFVQPVDEHREWGEEEWKDLLARFEELGLSWIVLQWSRPGAGLESTEAILRIADERGMKVLVGLAHDDTFWESIEREPDLLEVYFRRIEFESLELLREILPVAAAHPSFQGFYVPQEIDDVHWLEPAPRAVLFDFLRRVASRIGERHPSARIAISGFSNARADPGTLARFWAHLVRDCGIGTILFQDGIGTGKLDLRHLPLYLAPLHEAIESEGGELWPVVENFTQVEGPPLDERSFRAVPASSERLLQQLKAAARHSSGEVIAFSVPDYMIPSRGGDAEKLFREYRRRFPR